MKKFKLVIPDELIEVVKKSLMVKNGGIREEWADKIPKSWLIEIEEKSEAEEYVINFIKDYDRTEGSELWNQIKSDIKSAHEAGQKIGAKNERERFAQLVKTAIEKYSYPHDGIITDLFKAELEKLNKEIEL